ncbi:penicillin-binding protein 2 [Synechococcus elongatus]|uniref:Penicillin-binding protein 2 n=1 Tax=Synechococcus elongatus PCC 11801 TaxID=2219813 RepID=A0AAN1QLJ0_SYNEL|nr:penicillin-binding protein 2 [Synechococcus elongatus]AZB71327.1 penicillin-binding protein 2 [Synechococcus elongatus PCC 11801]
MANPPFSNRDSGRSVGRSYQSLWLLLGITTIFFGALGGRLAYMQIQQGERNRELANENRIHLLPRLPERGRILDREGRVLASSRHVYSLYVWPLAIKDERWPDTRKRLAKLLNLPESTLQARIDRQKENAAYRVRLAQNLSQPQVIAFEENRRDFIGVEIDYDSVRYYPNGSVAAHVLGYTGEISDEELKRREGQGYRPGDVIGQAGLEAAFEKQLRGEWGGQQVEVDALGNVVRILGDKKARAGQDVKITLDLDLQKAAEAAIGDTMGAIVAIDPRDGSILAMVSRPTYDPNVFATEISQAEWDRLQQLEFPFVNRALQAFPPASTFKIVTTAAALESGKYSPDTVLQTFPFLRVGGIQFWDWNNAGFGPLSFVGAMRYSSDTFFYQVAQRIGGEAIATMCRRFGMGERTGVELASEESRGLVPDNEWKVKNLDEEWTVGDSINMSIGQGFLLQTPLQVAVMFAIPANNGFRVKPHFLKDDRDSKEWREDLKLKPSTMKVIQDGLVSVVTEGTGKALNVPSLPPNAGKTGTAEDPPRRSHTWYGGYAPVDKPEIVVVSFNENSGGGGGSLAAPKVRQVFEAYFRKKALRAQAAKGKQPPATTSQ